MAQAPTVQDFDETEILRKQDSKRTVPAELATEPVTLDIPQGSYVPDRRGWRYLGVAVILFLLMLSAYLNGVLR
jgi:hypothetical protein